MKIDRVLRECYLQKKPVYIGIPVDVSNIEIEISTSTNLKPKSDKKILSTFIDDIKKEIKKSKSQTVLADYEVNRYKLNKELQNFIEKTNLPIASLSMGKGVFNENHKNFIGMYNGILSDEKVTSVIENSDCILLIGVKLTDSITAGFNYIHKDSISTIEIHPLYSKIGDKIYSDILMEDVLKELSNNIKFNGNITNNKKDKTNTELSGKLTQKKFFNIIEENLLPKDVLIAEQGTSFFGAGAIKLPENVTFVGQPLWGSIGYTFGALLGTCLANKNRRNILLIGDGSLQLTAQELSTMLRENINPIIIVINNDGYTVERYIHGPQRKYNDINMWDYTKLVDVFDVTLNRESLKFKASTVQDLIQALSLARENSSKLSLIEVSMDKDDAPTTLKEVGKLFSTQNNY